MIKEIVKNEPNININKLTKILNLKGYTNRNNNPFHPSTVFAIVQNNNIPVKTNKPMRPRSAINQPPSSDQYIDLNQTPLNQIPLIQPSLNQPFLNQTPLNQLPSFELYQPIQSQQ